MQAVIPVLCLYYLVFGAESDSPCSHEAVMTHSTVAGGDRERLRVNTRTNHTSHTGDQRVRCRVGIKLPV